MPNDFVRRNAEDLSQMCDDLLALVPAPPAPNGLGMTAAERTELASVASRIASAIQTQRFAEHSQRQATLEKASARTEAVGILNAIATTAFQAGTSPSVLAQYGFAPQRTLPSRPVPPVPVGNVQANLTGASSVLVTYDRSTNRDSTVFLIESSVDGLAWSQARATLRTREEITVQASPGLRFRVTATNSLGESAPSAEVTVYPQASSASFLRVA